MTDNIKLPPLPAFFLEAFGKIDYWATGQRAELNDWMREAVRLNAAPVADECEAFTKARQAGVFGPALDCCPTWYATQLRAEGWQARAALAAAPEPHGAPIPADMAKVLHENAWELYADGESPEPQGVPRSDFDAKVQEIGRARALVQEVFDMLSADHPARRLIAEKTGRWLVGFGPQGVPEPEQAKEEPYCWVTPQGEGFRLRFEPPVDNPPLGWTALYGQPQQSAQGVPEPAEPTNKEKLLANALGKCILASGIVRQDIDGLSGPQLLMFAEDLCQMLAAAPEPQAVPVPDALLRSAMERMDRARNLLTNGKPTPECNWGMLDTSDIRIALAAAPKPQAAQVPNGLLELLKDLEWDSDSRCPSCSAWKSEGHTKDCRLATAIDAAPEPQIELKLGEPVLQTEGYKGLELEPQGVPEPAEHGDGMEPPDVLRSVRNARLYGACAAVGSKYTEYLNSASKDANGRIPCPVCSKSVKLVNGRLDRFPSTIPHHYDQRGIIPSGGPKRVAFHHGPIKGKATT